MDHETDAALTAIYTLTPTHCGTGQASGAVDLPIAREIHTGYPVLPASSVKGVLRAATPGKRAEELFGSALSRDSTQSPSVGALVVSEARLVCFPVRSLSRPFLYATSSHLIERLARDLEAFGLAGLLPKTLPSPTTGALAADPALKEQTLVLEDLVYAAGEVAAPDEVGELARCLANFLPASQAATRARLESSLVVLGDAELRDLVSRTTPVQARVKLTSAKTTDKHGDETGNLWHEEALPTDCLLVSFASLRSGRQASGQIAALGQALGARVVLQIGGNETIGQGLGWWNLLTTGGAA